MIDDEEKSRSATYGELRGQRQSKANTFARMTCPAPVGQDRRLQSEAGEHAAVV